MERVCIVGLDEPEYTQIRERVETPIIAYEALPRIIVCNGKLLVEPRRGPGWISVSKIVFHSIYENDLDFIAALALWNGPCLPNAFAMMDCRLKLPCLVRVYSTHISGCRCAVMPLLTRRSAQTRNG